VLGLSLVRLEWVMRDRAPPPWTERLLGFAVRRGVSDQAVAEMAFALRPEPHGRSASERAPCRCARLGMMASAVAIILIIVTSAADAARRRVCQLSDYRDVQCAVFRLDPGRVD